MSLSAWGAVAALSAGLSLFALVRFGQLMQVSARQRRIVDRLGGAAIGPKVPIDDLDLPFFQRIVTPFWRQISRQLGTRLIPARAGAELQRKLQLSGHGQTPYAFAVTRLLVTLLLAALGIGLDTTGAVPTSDRLLVPLALAAVSYLYFGVRLNTRFKNAQEEFERALPEAFDLLSVSMEAGLSFEAALRKTTPHLRGVAGREFLRVVQDLEVGMTRQEALLALADRSRLPELRRFQSLVAQADRTGAGMASVLRAQAARVKEARVHRAREQAALVPVKILFPLVLFIFPALFVAVLGGGIISMLQSFSHGGI